jgi:hypothetical protein
MGHEVATYAARKHPILDVTIVTISIGVGGKNGR